MYRRYEDPRKVERMLREAKANYDYELRHNPNDEDRLVGLHEDIAELKERLNFAWMDQEAEEEGYDY